MRKMALRRALPATPRPTRGLTHIGASSAAWRCWARREFRRLGRLFDELLDRRGAALRGEPGIGLRIAEQPRGSYAVGVSRY